MSASTWNDRSRRRDAKSEPHSKRSESVSEKRGWIGVDFANFATAQPSRALLPLLILGLIVALGVAALRIDLIRTRYALAATMKNEKALIQEQRMLIVEKLHGRDPVALAVLARERGFRPANAVRTIADPMPLPGAPTFGLEMVALPSVAAGPPDDRVDTRGEVAAR